MIADTLVKSAQAATIYNPHWLTFTSCLLIPFEQLMHKYTLVGENEQNCD